MELKFLGRGSAFNPQEGNTSAYFIEDDQLFLIDCGESVFESIIAKKLLNETLKINLMITHTHSDHIGSLGSLVMYSFYKLHQSINIILPNDSNYLSSIENLLNIFGCEKSMYNFVLEDQYNNKYQQFQKINYVKTTHTSNLECYSIIFQTSAGIVYYSGDTNNIDFIQSLVDNNELIDKMYIETTTENYLGNVHIYVKNLEKIIPSNLKNKVYCMHINNNECMEEAKRIGFNVVDKL